MKKEAMPLEVDPRKWSLIELTASGLVCKGPSCVGYIHVCPFAPGTAYLCDIYDGESNMAIHKFAVEGQYESHDEKPVIPFYFERGIYVDFTAEVGSVTIQFNPIRV